MFNFEKLETRQKSAPFADLVYEVKCRFPNNERFRLKNQMHRTAVSILTHIAEGSARNSKTDYSLLWEIATGSCFEIVPQLFIGQRQKFFPQMDFQKPCVATEEPGKMLNRLRRSILASA